MSEAHAIRTLAVHTGQNLVRIFFVEENRYITARR
jgi:hypothetical protein